MVACGTNPIIIPVVSLKSGIFRYKKSSSQKEIKNKRPSKTENEVPTLYPKLEQSAPEAAEDAQHVECCVIYEANTSKFHFQLPSGEDEHGAARYTRLECTNVSGADLSVSTKFGWETMTCHLMVECYEPLYAWTTVTNTTTGEVEQHGIQQESCMVKSSFEVTHIEKLRILLQSVKLAQLKERRNFLERSKKGEAELGRLPVKMQEGLPYWVAYIPAKWYSCSVRKVIEYTLVIYTVLALLWAIWQLYKHVDFIQRHLQPFFRFIEKYLTILRDWFRYLDLFLDAMTKAWWRYMKPIWMLYLTFYASLAQIFKPLRNVAGLLGGIFGPLVNAMQATWTALKPLFTPVAACWRFISLFMQKVGGLIGDFLFFTTNNTFVHYFMEKLRQLGVTRLLHNIVHGGLDPFRAQFVVIRDLLIKSVKQIYYGVRFIVTRVYIVIYHWKRERRLHRDEIQNDASHLADGGRLKSE